MARVPVLDSTALESAHHFHHIPSFEASHKASTDSREWKNIVHLLMKGTTMSLCMEFWTQRASFIILAIGHTGYVGKGGLGG